jgi:hypothetical protein
MFPRFARPSGSFSQSATAVKSVAAAAGVSRAAAAMSVRTIFFMAR